MPFIVKIKKQLALYELTVDLETEAGILAVIGGSGSGKSMTLKCIAGIETPDSGFISLNGRVLYDSSKRSIFRRRNGTLAIFFRSTPCFRL